MRHRIRGVTRRIFMREDGSRRFGPSFVVFQIAIAAIALIVILAKLSGW
jgi:hypothetical protein